MVDFFARGMVFALPDANMYRFPADYPHQDEVYRPVWEGSNRTVPCVVVGNPGHGRRILLFHGNGETILGARGMAMDIARRCDARVFIIDYPGYWMHEDGSPPSPRTAGGVYSAAYAAAKILGGDGRRFHVVGYSLGTALAVRVARDHGNAVESMSLIAPICSALSTAASSPNKKLRGLRAFVSVIKPFISTLDVFCAERDAPFVGRPAPYPQHPGTRCSIVYGDQDEIVNSSQSVRMSKLLGASIVMVKGESHTTIQESDEALEFVTRTVFDRGPV